MARTSTPAEVYACDRCPFVYEAPLPLSAAPIHPCPRPGSPRRRPARKVTRP